MNFRGLAEKHVIARDEDLDDMSVALETAGRSRSMRVSFVSQMEMGILNVHWKSETTVYGNFHLAFYRRTGAATGGGA